MNFPLIATLLVAIVLVVAVLSLVAAHGRLVVRLRWEREELVKRIAAEDFEQAMRAQGSPAERAIKRVLGLIVERFVYAWHRDLSTDASFPRGVERVLTRLLEVLIERSREQSVQVLVAHVIHEYAAFVRRYRRASSVEQLHRRDRQLKRRSASNADVARRDAQTSSTVLSPTVGSFDSLGRGEGLHRALESIEHEHRYLKEAIDLLLTLALPPAERQCVPGRRLLAEVLAKNALMPLVALLSAPDKMYRIVRDVLRPTTPEGRAQLETLGKSDFDVAADEGDAGNETTFDASETDSLFSVGTLRTTSVPIRPIWRGDSTHTPPLDDDDDGPQRPSTALLVAGSAYRVSVPYYEHGTDKDYAVFAVRVNTVDPATSEVVCGWLVPRRFREFDALNGALRARGIATPRFPRRWVVAAGLLRMTGSYLNDRREQLDRYLLELLSHPEAVRTPELRDFLDPTLVDTMYAASNGPSAPRSSLSAPWRLLTSAAKAVALAPGRLLRTVSSAQGAASSSDASTANDLGVLLLEEVDTDAAMSAYVARMARTFSRRVAVARSSRRGKATLPQPDVTTTTTTLPPETRRMTVDLPRRSSSSSFTPPEHRHSSPAASTPISSMSDDTCSLFEVGDEELFRRADQPSRVLETLPESSHEGGENAGESTEIVSPQQEEQRDGTRAALAVSASDECRREKKSATEQGDMANASLAEPVWRLASALTSWGDGVLQWRRRLFLRVAGPIVDELMQEKIEVMTSERQVRQMVLMVQRALFEQDDDDTNETEETLREEAREELVALLSGVITMVAGKGTVANAVELVLSSLEHPTLNRHLLYTLLDAILAFLGAADEVPDETDGV